MSDLFDEVLNEEKNTRKVNLFKKFLPIIAIVAFCCAVVISLYSWYDNNQKQQNQGVGDLIVKAAEQSDTNISIINLHDQGNDVQQQLIKLIDVSSKKKADDAMPLLENIIENGQNLEVTRAYARILWLSYLLKKSNYTEQQKEKSARYANFFNSPSKPFYGSGLLLKSLLHLQQKQFELVQSTADKIISSPKIPDIIKEQAKAINLKSEQIQHKTK